MRERNIPVADSVWKVAGMAASHTRGSKVAGMAASHT